MIDIQHRIGIRAPIDAVYRALATQAGLAHWWTEDVRGEARPGGRIDFRFRAPDGTCVGEIAMAVIELAEGQRVRWRCVAGPAEWIDTEIRFELLRQDGLTIVRFGHLAWREAVEFTAHCSMKWATFLLSLRDYVETGHGRPAPGDLKIDNWN